MTHSLARPLTLLLFALSAVPVIAQLPSRGVAVSRAARGATPTAKRVADEAERFGDLAGRLEALVDASMLYVEAGRPRQARALVSAAQLLLHSPAIPDAARLSAARRIGYR